MVSVFEDIESNGVFDICEIEEDDIIAPRFRNLVEDFFIEVTVWIYQAYSSASIYILENHAFEHRCFATSGHSYDQHVSFECFCIDRNELISYIISENYNLFCYLFLFFSFFNDRSYCFSCWSDISWIYFDYFFF